MLGVLSRPPRRPRWPLGETSLMPVRPSAQYSLTLRVELDRRPGQLGLLASAIGEAGGVIGHVDRIETGEAKAIRELTVMASDQEHSDAIVTAAEAVDGCHLIRVADRTFELHRGGKLYTGLTAAITTRDDLSMAYTPGVGRVCMAIHDDPDKAYEYTIKANTVAVVSGGGADVAQAEHRAAVRDHGHGVRLDR